MRAARKVEWTSPTTERTNSFAADGLEPLIERIEQLITRPTPARARDSERPPGVHVLVSSKPGSQTHPTTPDRNVPWTIDDLRATLIARAEQEQKRGVVFRLGRLILRKVLRPSAVICVSVLALGVA